MVSDDRYWYAIYTRARHEKRVEAQIREKGIEVYLPVHEVLKQWSDRKKWVSEPLFSCYCFVFATPVERVRALDCTGAVRVLGFNGKPAIVHADEILRIRRILKEVPDAEACDGLHIGDRVRIIRGNLAGMEGRLEESRGESRFVITVSSIRQAVRFNVALADIEVVAQ